MYLVGLLILFNFHLALHCTSSLVCYIYQSALFVIHINFNANVVISSIAFDVMDKLKSHASGVHSWLMQISKAYIDWYSHIVCTGIWYMHHCLHALNVIWLDHIIYHRVSQLLCDGSERNFIKMPQNCILKNEIFDSE